MYRIRDIKNNTWVKENIYLSPYPHSDLYLAKKSFFGRYKLKLVSSNNYVIHKDIELCDKNGVLIFEGDYCKLYTSEEKEIIGMVAYIHQLSSYAILRLDKDEFFNLSSELSEYIEVIGNVFDGYGNREE